MKQWLSRQWFYKTQVPSLLCLVQSLTHSLTQWLVLATFVSSFIYHHCEIQLWRPFKANWEFDVRAKNADCEGWMCAVKALTPKIATEHLMVNALRGFEIVVQAWKIADCEFQCLSHVKPSLCLTFVKLIFPMLKRGGLWFICCQHICSRFSARWQGSC